jgi:hypothetical protein
MDALSLNYEIISDAEREVFDQWMQEYSLSLEEILKITKLAIGKRNKFAYVKKIIENRCLAQQ